MREGDLSRVGGGHSWLAREEGDERKLSKKVLKILQEKPSFFAVFGVLFQSILFQMPPSITKYKDAQVLC